jgi:hypothetical protein
MIRRRNERPARAAFHLKKKPISVPIKTKTAYL